MSASITRASASNRWMHCHESPWLEQQFPDVPNDAADEGTAAHEMAELVLTNQFLIDELVDRKSSNGVIFVDEMVDHVQMYVDHVQQRKIGTWVEKTVSLFIDVNLPPVSGKCDSSCYSLDTNNNILYIDDFKYGFGYVDVFENWQLIIYALGIMTSKEFDGNSVSQIVFTIIQPRGYHHEGPIRTWSISYQDLVTVYYQRICTAVKSIHSTTRMCRSGSWCKHCKALANCATAKAASANAVDVIMSAIPDTDTPLQIAELLDLLKRASDTVKHTQDAINARAESMISNGQPVPGYSIQPGIGKRKFTDETAAISTAKCFGVDITNNKIVTPAEAKRRGLPDAVYQSISHSPSTAPRLVKHNMSKQADKEFKS